MKTLPQIPRTRIAAALGLSRATAYRHWTYARAWLRDAISRAESD